MTLVVSVASSKSNAEGKTHLVVPKPRNRLSSNGQAAAESEALSRARDHQSQNDPVNGPTSTTVAVSHEAAQMERPARAVRIDLVA